MFSKQELPKVFPKDTHKEILLLLPTIARTIAVGRGDTPRNLQAERSTARLLRGGLTTQTLVISRVVRLKLY